MLSLLGQEVSPKWMATLEGSSIQPHNLDLLRRAMAERMELVIVHYLLLS